MALPIALRVAGQGLSAVAEGLQKVPELQDQDEEIAYRRAERPLTLEEARLRLQKTRADINKPHFMTHGI